MRMGQCAMKFEIPFSKGRLHHGMLVKLTAALNAEWRTTLVKIPLASLLVHQGKVNYEL